MGVCAGGSCVIALVTSGEWTGMEAGDQITSFLGGGKDALRERLCEWLSVLGGRVFPVAVHQ